MPHQEEIDQQQQLLATYRRTLATLLAQYATFSSAYAPPQLVAGIAEARAGIAQCKAALRAWGVVVEDLPDDAVRAEGPIRPHAAAPAGSASLHPHSDPPPLPLDDPAPVIRAAVFPLKRRDILIERGCTVALLGAGGLLALVALVALLATFLSSAAPSRDAAQMALFGALLLAAGWWGQRNVSRLRTTRIHVFADRLEYHAPEQVQIYRWDDVSAVWQAVVETSNDTPIRYGYALRTWQRAHLTITQSFQDQAALEAAIRAGVRAPLLQRLRTAYQEHGEVTFSSQFTVNQRGVGFGGDYIPWRCVEQVDWNDFMIWLRRSDALEPMRLDLTGPDTANFFIFAEFVNAIIAAQRPASAQH